MEIKPNAPTLDAPILDFMFSPLITIPLTLCIFFLSDVKHFTSGISSSFALSAHLSFSSLLPNDIKQ